MLALVELREYFRLSLEPIQPFLVLGERLMNNFDGNVTPELGVACAVDFSHATCTDRLDDFVVSELGSGGERHR